MTVITFRLVTFIFAKIFLPYIFLQNYFELVFVLTRRAFNLFLYHKTRPRLPPLSKWWRCEAAVQGYWDTAQNMEFFLTTNYEISLKILPVAVN